MIAHRTFGLSRQRIVNVQLCPFLPFNLAHVFMKSRFPHGSR